MAAVAFPTILQSPSVVVVVVVVDPMSRTVEAMRVTGVELFQVRVVVVVVELIERQVASVPQTE